LGGSDVPVDRRHLVVAALTIGAGGVSAQTTGSDAQSSTTAKVENWTIEQWNAAKADWAKDKTKWADCQQQSTDRELADRKSWSFLYTCMTKSS
jgi:predicted flavoprotein YhiN